MNKAVLGNLANMTVSELGWDQRPVVSVCVRRCVRRPRSTRGAVARAACAGADC
jgi:hypothetical protein